MGELFNFLALNVGTEQKVSDKVNYLPCYTT